MGYRIFFFVSLAIAAGLVAYNLVGPAGGGKQAQLQQELSRLLRENQALKEQNRRHLLEVQALKERTEYLERVAREDLGLVKPGEMVLQFPKVAPESEDLPRLSTAAKDPPAPMDGGNPEH